MKIKSRQKFLCYSILYACIPYYMKIKSKRKLEMRNITLKFPPAVYRGNILQYTRTSGFFLSRIVCDQNIFRRKQDTNQGATTPIYTVLPASTTFKMLDRHKIFGGKVITSKSTVKIPLTAMFELL